MAGKILTTARKKWIATAALLLSGWYTITMNGNVLSLPNIPEFVTKFSLGNINILFVAGIVTVLVVFMIWTDY